MHENIDVQPTEPKKVIAWEKWRDPFGSDANETEWPGAWGNFHTDAMVHAHLHGHEDDIDYDFDDEDDLPEPPRPMRQKQVNMGMLTTPMGIIPMTETTRAGNIFNFWTAHCNFRITEEVAEIVENTDGIESLDIFTPYRWRVSIGKAFSSTQVKDNVQKNLGALPMQPE